MQTTLDQALKAYRGLSPSDKESYIRLLKQIEADREREEFLKGLEDAYEETLKKKPKHVEEVIKELRAL